MTTSGAEDAWQARYLSAACDFAEQCAKLRESNPFKQPALDEVAGCLATELWDRGGSQSEIRDAFETSVSSLIKYAAGEERRGDRTTLVRKSDGQGLAGGRMRRLVIALALIAAIYTLATLVIAYSEIHSNVPVYDMMPVALYFVPIAALWSACAMLWRITRVSAARLH